MVNPVLKKELKTKMRTWRTAALISVYILIVSGFLLLIFLEPLMGYRYYMGFNPDSLKTMYFATIILQMFLVIFIVPATTAGSISGERERSTFDLLICTKLSSLSVVLGKLGAALSQIVLLLVVSIPVLSILFLFGGISPGNILTVFAFYLVTAIFFGSIGIFTSAFFRKTITATVVSYLIAGFLTGGTFIIVMILREFFITTPTNQARVFFPTILYTNPITGIASIVSHQLGEDILGGLTGRSTGVSPLTPLYINMLFDLVASAVLLYLSSMIINPMKRFGNRIKVKKKKKTVHSS